MKKQYRSEFDRRQKMRKENYEIFYYSDQHFQSVSEHKHDYYEFYFPVSGKIEMEIRGKRTPLSNCDAVIVPPHTPHRALTENSERSYCRYVFWISVSYFKRLCTAVKGLGYITEQADSGNCIHHFTENEYSRIQSKILRLIEEDRSERYGNDSFTLLAVCDLILTLSRIVYEHDHPRSRKQQEDPVQIIMEYIENNLDEDLSLESLGDRFFLSQSHIAHIFLERTGMTVHRYITKKRLERCADEIKTGRPAGLVYQEYGFRDYSVFFRAFKKEYDISPREYQALYLRDPDYPDKRKEKASG
ncbi:MAG: AraC family transcriptional regulator [Solobacterium sp.]|nr:AraC family transcriptional regulator [Solobacterium sp.]